MYKKNTVIEATEQGATRVTTEFLGLDEEYFKCVDLINSFDLKLLLDEMFLNEDVNTLSQKEIFDFIIQAKKIKALNKDYEIFELIFKTYAPVHYYHNSYGLILMLNLHSLCDKKKKSGSSGFVYVCLSDIGKYKIGASVNPERRVKELGLGSSIKHKLLFKIKSDDMFALEKILHDKFASDNIHSEWFDLDEDGIRYLNSLSYADMV